MHFTCDNPNMPSDLEQMSNLLNFLKQNGTLDSGDHTVLTSHTANDILTTEIGLYSDDDGIFVANSFGPNFFFESFGTLRPTVFTGDSWNHGDIQPEIGRTFIGIVGPGVSNLGITQPQDFFTDHVDVRPTLMTLTGLTDDYSHDGRIIFEMLNSSVLPASLGNHRETALLLGQALKQIDAPFGPLAMATLNASTVGITSNSPNDSTYNMIEGVIESWTARRDTIAAQIKANSKEQSSAGFRSTKARRPR